MQSLGAILAGAGAGIVSTILKSKKKSKGRTQNSRSSLAERLQNKVDMHVAIHQGLDFRTTVYLLGHLGVLAIEGSLFKDNLAMLPIWFMVAIAGAATCGATATAISLFARSWSGRARTRDVILREERCLLQQDPEIEPAEELARCERASSRKRPSSNISLILLVVQLELLAFGMAFFR